MSDLDRAEAAYTETWNAATSLVRALAREAQRRDNWPQLFDDGLRFEASEGHRVYPNGTDDVARATLGGEVLGKLDKVVPAFNREMMIQMHGDPLSNATRDMRRNLDAVAAAVVLGATFTTGEVEVLSLKVHLSGFLAVALFLLLSYHVVAFVLYRRSDIVKFQNVRQWVNEYVQRLREAVDAIEVHGRQLRTLGQNHEADRVGAWVTAQRLAIDKYEHETSNAKRRELWEFLAPLVLGTLAYAALGLRSFTTLLPVGHAQPDCADAKQTLKEAKAEQARVCSTRDR